MSRRALSVVVSVLIAVGVSSCASAPEPEWDLGEAGAGDFTEAATSAEGFLGAGSFRVGPETPAQDEPSVTLDYPVDARLDGLRVACFGEGQIRFGFSSRSASSWTGSDPIDVDCDGEANQVSFPEPLEHVDAISFHGALNKGSGAVVAVVVSGSTD